jgi:hypothetical protein
MLIFQLRLQRENPTMRSQRVFNFSSALDETNRETNSSLVQNQNLE